VEGLFERLPKYFRTEEDKSQVNDNSTASEESDKPKKRAADWWINPSVSEWHYKITAPLGFKLRALPADKNEKVDTLTFTQKYSANPEGTVVEAVLRVENPNTRMTAEQARGLRDAVVKARNSDPIYVTFDHIGESLIAAGKIKEGLAAYQQIAFQHPKEALHKVQLAQALLANGMGEQARVVALEATRLEPNSALAFSTLGEVRKYDLIGRLLKKGMDFDGSVAAYKKAIALDPKDKETLANFGLMLEYDADGNRYSDKAPLKDAAAQLRELKKLDEAYARGYDDNLLFDLWYAHDYQGVFDYAATLPASDIRKGLTLAAIAVLQSADAALKKSLQITTDDQSRSQTLLNAGTLLSRIRKYREASTLLAEAARGRSNSSQVLRSASIFGNTKPYSELKIDPADPRSVVQQMFSEMVSGNLTLDEFKSLTYENSADSINAEQFQQMMSTLKDQLSSSGLPLITVADLTISNMHYTVDGDDSLGYKVIVEATGAPPQNIFVVRDGPYKIAAFSAADRSVPEELSSIVLAEIDKNHLAAAAKWLDRARDEIHLTDGDDPLSGQPFPHFWTKGQQADVSALRTAALVLLPSKQVKGPYLASLLEAKNTAPNDVERSRLALVLAYAYQAQKQWSEMLAVTQELRKAFPDSLRAFDLSVAALAGLKRYDDWEKLVQDRTQAHPDEMAYARSAAQLAAYRGQFAKARAIVKSIADRGQATGNDLNLFAWYSLVLPGPIDQETIDVALRANDLTKNSSFAVLHTLGCVYAQAGKTKEARELLLRAMDALHLEQPNSEIWFGLGLIAEQYGVADAAEKIYGRVEKGQVDYPATSYSIAQQHLAALRTAGGNSTKSAGQ
jgi:tetratricopeptide (TPR) repeat protein